MVSFLRYAFFSAILCVLEAFWGTMPHTILRPCFLFMASCFIAFWHNEMQTCFFALIFGCLAFFLGYPTYVIFLYPMISLLICRYGRQESRILARAYYSAFLLLLSSLLRFLSILLMSKINILSFIPILLFEAIFSFLAFFLITLLAQMTHIVQRKLA